jgi:type II secretory pathway pseudopilin PulG
MLVMIILSGLAVSGYFSATRGSAMRSAVNHLRSSLLLARQQAMMSGKTTYVVFEHSTNGESYVICQRRGVTTQSAGAVVWDDFTDLSGLPVNTTIYRFDGEEFDSPAAVITATGSHPTTDRSIWEAGSYYALESGARIAFPREFWFKDGAPDPVVFRGDGTVDGTENREIEVYESNNEQDVAKVIVECPAGVVTIDIPGS